MQLDGEPWEQPLPETSAAQPVITVCGRYDLAADMRCHICGHTATVMFAFLSQGYFLLFEQVHNQEGDCLYVLPLGVTDHQQQITRKDVWIEIERTGDVKRVLKQWEHNSQRSSNARRRCTSHTRAGPRCCSMRSWLKGTPKSVQKLAQREAELSEAVSVRARTLTLISDRDP